MIFISFDHLIMQHPPGVGVRRGGSGELCQAIDTAICAHTLYKVL